LVRIPFIGQIGDMAEHPGQHQPAARHDAKFVVMAVMEIRIGQNRLPGHFVERDIHGLTARRGGDHQRVAHPLGKGNRPLHGLHPAKTAADDPPPIAECRAGRPAGPDCAPSP
jgi:hypothetical protein